MDKHGMDHAVLILQKAGLSKGKDEEVGEHSEHLDALKAACATFLSALESKNVEKACKALLSFHEIAELMHDEEEVEEQESEFSDKDPEFGGY